MKLLKALTLLVGLAWMLQAETLKLTGTSGEVSNGYSIGPYILTVNGVTTLMACDDFFHTINPGQSWEADRLPWSSLTVAEQPLYGAAYWLAGAILNGPAPHADSQWALWHLFYGPAPLPGGATSQLAWAEAAYAGNPTYAGYQGLVAWRPDPRCSGQEMLTVAGDPVPEPASLGLVGIVLLLFAVAGVCRRGAAGRGKA